MTEAAEALEKQNFHDQAVELINNVRSEFPGIQEALEEQYETHSLDKYPYHSCLDPEVDGNTDENGIPIDHIEQGMYWCARLCLEDEENNLDPKVAVVAFAMHDYHQGDGHEEQNAQEAEERLGLAEDYEFTRKVMNCIRATILYQKEGSVWVQNNSFEDEARIVQLVDLIAFGKPWGDALEVEVNAAREFLSKDEDGNILHGKPLSDDYSLSKEKWIGKLNFTLSIIENFYKSVTEKPNDVFSKYFPNVGANVRIYKQLIHLLEESDAIEYSVNGLYGYGYQINNTSQIPLS